MNTRQTLVFIAFLSGLAAQTALAHDDDPKQVAGRPPEQLGQVSSC